MCVRLSFFLFLLGFCMILLGNTLFHFRLLLYFVLCRLEDKRQSEGIADSGFEVRRRGFFVILLKLWGPLMIDVLSLLVQHLGCVRRVIFSSRSCHKLRL